MILDNHRNGRNQSKRKVPFQKIHRCQNQKYLFSRLLSFLIEQKRKLYFYPRRNWIKVKTFFLYVKLSLEYVDLLRDGKFDFALDRVAYTKEQLSLSKVIHFWIPLFKSRRHNSSDRERRQEDERLKTEGMESLDKISPIQNKSKTKGEKFESLHHFKLFRFMTSRYIEILRYLWKHF